MTKMKSLDWGLIGGGILLSLIAGYLAHIGSLSRATVDALAMWLPRFSIVVILMGVVFIYLSRDRLGGSVSRNLSVVAAGFLIYGFIYWPHKVSWHGTGEPAWLGISAGAWQTTFHLLTVSTLVIVAYGFYLFWQMAQEEVKS